MIAASTLVMGACAGAKSTIVAHGTYAISCKRSQMKCYEEAQLVCGPQGFDVLDERQKTTMMPATSTSMVPVHEGDLLVRCRGAFQAAPQCVPQGFACHAQTTCCYGLSCNSYSNGWACGPAPAPAVQ